MGGKLGNSWLEWAVDIEDAVDCDVEAGLDLGQNLGKYIAKTQTYISHEKLMSILHEDLGAIFSEEEIELIAKKTESFLCNYIQEKLHHSNVA